MRKYFLSFVALAAGLFATSCQESLVEPQVAGPTTFTVQLPEQMGTKAIGDAENVNKLLVEVYPAGKENAIYQTVKTISQGKTTIELSLIQDQAYDILFWAQKNDGYVTVTNGEFGSLRSVPMNNKFSNDDNGAAFFHAEKGFVPTGASKEVKLRRPFAQLNLGTTAKSLETNAGNFELVSSQITITGVATSFNVFTGEGFGNADVEYVYESANVPTEDLIIGTAPNTTTYDYVSMNYLSVLGNEKDLVNVGATIVVKKGNEQQEITHTFTSVPVQENYRTNIVGNLISSTNDFNVIIDEGWDGEEYNYIAPGIKLVNGEYHIVSAEGLWSMAESLNASTKSTGHDLNGKTIKLAVDVDLQNKPWTPIKSFTNNSGKAIFDGQGHTIKNLNIENSYRGGIFEYVVGSIKNLNLDGVTITATRQAGAIVGQIYGNITDCSVNNVKITLTPEFLSEENVYDNGDKVGALAGLVGGQGYSFTGNKATNVTLSAFRDLGGLIGAAHPSTITGNTLENITLIVNKTISYTDENGDPYEDNANQVLGSQRGGVSTVEDNTVTGYKVLRIDDSNNETSEVKAAVEAAQEGETVVIPDSYQGTLPTPKEKITIICEPGTVFEGTSSLNIKGSTLVGATFKNDNGAAVSGTINGVFEDCSFKGENPLYFCYAGDTPIIFKDCTFEGDDYTFHFDDGSANSKITCINCTFKSDWRVAIGAGISLFEAIDCVFDVRGFVNMHGNANLTNCEFVKEPIYWIANVGKTIYTDCKYVGRTLVADDINIYSYAIIDGEHYVADAESLALAVKEGATEINLLPEEYDVYGCGGKNLVLNGREEVVFKIMNDGEAGLDAAFDGSTVTFNNITFNTLNNTGSYKGYTRLTGIYNNCNFIGEYCSSNNTHTFNNCTFDTRNGYFWTWGATSVTFNGCEWGTNSKAILAHGGANTVININNCKFNAKEKGYTGAGDWTSVVEIDPAGSNLYTINFTGENTKTEFYSGWTRVKDGSTGHIINGL